MKVDHNAIWLWGLFGRLCFWNIKKKQYSLEAVILKFTIYFSYGLGHSFVGLSVFHSPFRPLLLTVKIQLLFKKYEAPHLNALHTKFIKEHERPVKHIRDIEEYLIYK